MTDVKSLKRQLRQATRRATQLAGAADAVRSITVMVRAPKDRARNPEQITMLDGDGDRDVKLSTMILADGMDADIAEMVAKCVRDSLQSFGLYLEQLARQELRDVGAVEDGE